MPMVTVWLTLIIFIFLNSQILNSDVLFLSSPLIVEKTNNIPWYHDNHFYSQRLAEITNNR